MLVFLVVGCGDNTTTDENNQQTNDDLLKFEGIEFNNKLSSTTWEKSLIRQWLNNDFINNTFNTEEYGHIQTTRVKTIDGVYNNVNGGNATDDKIFLLSVEEIEK